MSYCCFGAHSRILIYGNCYARTTFIRMKYEHKSQKREIVFILTGFELKQNKDETIQIQIQIHQQKRTKKINIRTQQL